MTSAAIALDLLFGGLTTTPDPQYQWRKMDFLDRIDYPLK